MSKRNERLLWLHDRINSGSCPNAAHIADRFGVSVRQGQRDVEYMKNFLNAPIEYDYLQKGFKYSKKYSLPKGIAETSDEDFSGIATKLAESTEKNHVQLQIPYTAEIEVRDKLAVLELKSYITESHPKKHRYICQFHSVELFLGVIMTLNAGIKIISPVWLRERAVASAEKILNANKE